MYELFELRNFLIDSPPPTQRWCAHLRRAGRGLIYVDFFFSPSDGMEIDIGPVRRCCLWFMTVLLWGRQNDATALPCGRHSGHIGYANILLFTFRRGVKNCCRLPSRVCWWRCLAFDSGLDLCRTFRAAGGGGCSVQKALSQICFRRPRLMCGRLQLKVTAVWVPWSRIHLAKLQNLSASQKFSAA